MSSIARLVGRCSRLSVAAKKHPFGASKTSLGSICGYSKGAKNLQKKKTKPVQGGQAEGEEDNREHAEDLDKDSCNPGGSVGGGKGFLLSPAERDYSNFDFERLERLCDKSIAFLNVELGGIRVGLASPSMMRALRSLCR